MDSRYGSKHGHRDEERRSRKLFIGGVSFDTTDEDFFKYFARFGELEDCVLIREKDTGQSRGFGFVTYKDKAISEHVAQQQLYLDGRRLDPKPSISRFSMDKIHEHRNQTTKVFVGGLHDDTAEAELTEYFMKFGEVLEVNIMYDRFTNAPRGFGFVTFKEPDVAQKVIDWTEDHLIHHKKVDCKPATARKDAFSREQRESKERKRASSREERWKKYHGDEVDDRDRDRPHYPAHLSQPPSYPPTAYTAVAAHAQMPATHSSYSYSSTHPPYSHHPQPHLAQYPHYPPPPTHYPPAPAPAPVPAHAHAPSHHPHDPHRRATPAATATTATPATATTATTVPSSSASASATVATATSAVPAPAPATTYDYSRYDPYYRHDTRYSYPPPAHSHSTHQAPPTYDYSHYAKPASYPPYSSYPRQDTRSTAAPRYDYYSHSQYPPNTATATSTTAVPTATAAVPTNASSSSTTTATTANTASTASTIPPIAAPVKMGKQTQIPTSYGGSRGSAATNSAQSARYSAY